MQKTNALIDIFASQSYGKSSLLWQNVGNLESKTLAKKLANTEIQNPIYISGLARSGTTILLEILSHHSKLAYHSYRDFATMFTPYIANKIYHFFDSFCREEKPQERSHKDGIMVSSRSPEAMEEILWQYFFTDLHSQEQTNILDRKNANKKFADFYSQHIKKLLLAQQKKYYIAKSNYNITRVDYILSLFPDAKFVIVVRDPVAHIDSYIQTHQHFVKQQKQNKNALKHMNLSGHFEFGLNFKPIVIDSKNNKIIKEEFAKNNLIHAFSLYWNEIHNYINQISQNFKENILLVRYEDLCNKKSKTIDTILKFCQLEDEKSTILKQYQQIIREDDNKNLSLKKDEIELVKKITKKTKNLFYKN